MEVLLLWLQVSVFIYICCGSVNVCTVAGSGTEVNLGVQATSASLYLPERVCGDTQGLLYISDSGEL